MYFGRVLLSGLSDQTRPDQAQAAQSGRLSKEPRQASWQVGGCVLASAFLCLTRCCLLKVERVGGREARTGCVLQHDTRTTTGRKGSSTLHSPSWNPEAAWPSSVSSPGTNCFRSPGSTLARKSVWCLSVRSLECCY